MEASCVWALGDGKEERLCKPTRLHEAWWIQRLDDLDLVIGFPAVSGDEHTLGRKNDQQPPLGFLMLS